MKRARQKEFPPHNLSPTARKATPPWPLADSKHISSYYFTNHPEDWSVGSMWRVFMNFGRTVDIYCPSRPNRTGHKFGFVRYVGVLDREKLERELNQIWVGSHKLRVSVARHRIQQHGHPQNHTPSKSNVPKTQLARRTSHFTSYAEAIKQSLERKPTVVAEFAAQEEDVKRLQNFYVGQVHDRGLVPELQSCLYMEGCLYCTIKPLGGKLVLLESDDSDELRDFVHNGREWLEQWFEDIRPWTSTEVSTERLVWLRFQGVPLHVWHSATFEKLALWWGKPVSLDDCVLKRTRFDVAKCLISTSYPGLIAETITISVDKRLFHIRVNEEISGVCFP